ncbi:MAG: autotransporter-associated beta strand repeat-containing protein [Verrucomicrobia bacterium]|nr:autotransporter-associated beta strand repeat-containing protein [Verrucomicrobiota bacterium]
MSERLRQVIGGMLVLGWLGGAGPSPAQERILGADISYWNCGSSATGISQNNWNTAFTSGKVKFVWIRATRGGTTGVDQPQGTPGGGSASTLARRYDDSRFIQNITRATTAGMMAGAYHFARPDIIASTAGTGGVANTGADEADHFMQMAGPWMRPGYLMPMYDLEAGQGQRSANELAQFSVDFSSRIYQVMRIRPAIYINGNYSSILQGASASLRDQLAKPAALRPSVVSPAYPMLWDARYANNDNPSAIPIQTGSPKHTPTTLNLYYGPWDDYGDAAPWSFWQYASTVSIPGFNSVDTTVDGDVSQGDIEYVRNSLVPAVWWHDANGDWSTLANWNSGQTPVAPVTPAGQAPPYATGPLPVARLPGAAGSGPTSGQYDTVILERPNANILVTVSTGVHNIRKLYMREALNLTGGSLTINYDPTYRANNSATVLHGGPISAQFSGPVTLNGGTLNVHTLQVDATRTFTLASGTLAWNRIFLMPHNTAPARIFVTGNVNLNPRANATAIIANGSGTGLSGRIELSGGTRTFTIGNGTAEVDLSIDAPINNGGLDKAGAGTLRLTAANLYAGGTTITAGRLLVNNTSGSGTGSGSVTVNGGTLGGTGTIGGAVTVNPTGRIAPGTESALGTLTLGSPPSILGTNFMRINRGAAPSADKLVLTSGTLTYGGHLEVANTGAALTGGEVFTLYAAGSYGGAFVSSNLPPLASGLNWDLGRLVADGRIAVNRRPAAGTPPSFTNTAPAVLEIPFATLISRATDPDGDALTVTGVSLTSAQGIVLTTNATSIFYSNRVSMTDQFNYLLSDGRGGSATGSVQVVNIGAPPAAEFSGLPTVTEAAVQLQFTATPAWTYFLERSTNLVDWTTIATNVAPPSGVIDYTDQFSDLGAPVSPAFYRLRWSP